jgi:hypothetical protein
MSEAVIGAEVPWYRLLTRSQWNTLIASNLGWMFDGYETFALVMAVGAALHQLLDPSQYTQIPVYAGLVIALTCSAGALAASSAAYSPTISAASAP